MPSDFAIACICITIILALLVFSVWLGQRRADRLALAPTPKPGPPGSGPSWRKAVPYLLFVGTGLLFVLSHLLAHELLWQVALWKGLSTVPTKDAASAADIFVEQNLSGWPTIGRATGKLIMAAGFYALASFLPFLVQRSTHPGVNRWKRKGYTLAFDALLDSQKFDEAAKVDNRATFRMAICILSAALIN